MSSISKAASAINLRNIDLRYFFCSTEDKFFIHYRLLTLKHREHGQQVALFKAHVDLDQKKCSSDALVEVATIIDRVCQQSFHDPKDCPIYGFKFIKAFDAADDLHTAFAQVTVYFRAEILVGRILFLQEFAAALASSKTLAFSQSREDTVGLNSLAEFQKIKLLLGLSLRFADDTRDPYIAATNFLVVLVNQLKQQILHNSSKSSDDEDDGAVLDEVRRKLASRIGVPSTLEFINQVFSDCYAALEKCGDNIEAAIKFLQVTKQLLHQRMMIVRKIANATHLEEELAAESKSAMSCVML